jgi:transcriptional regulator with XRE-family HTH domain
VQANPLKKERLAIARKLRDLREARRLTQAELARRLGISQPKLSQVEAGNASLTAEQFLVVLRTFQVSVTAFAEAAAPTDELQATLGRLGATQLQEDTDILPSERLERVTDAIRETLVDADAPRLVTALAPVIVRNIDHINWPRLAYDLTKLGRGHRFHWLIENVLEAVRALADDRATAVEHRRLYRRAQAVLENVRELADRDGELARARVPDVMERGVRTKRTQDEVAARSSPIARRYNIVTSLGPTDFIEALRGARVGG